MSWVLHRVDDRLIHGQVLIAWGERMRPARIWIADDAAASDEAAIAAYVGQCLESLQGRADPRFYTTGEAIADLDAVRAALGVEKINVMGGSYGTRVAQQYAAAHPRHTRAVVLDSVVPNTLVLGQEHARNLEAAKKFYDWSLTAEVQSRAKEANSFQVPSNKGATTSDKAPDLSTIKLIDYDFKKYGSSDERKRLLAKWDAEVGSLPQ